MYTERERHRLTTHYYNNLYGGCFFMHVLIVHPVFVLRSLQPKYNTVQTYG